MTGVIAALGYTAISSVPISVQLTNQTVSRIARNATAVATYTINNSGNVVGSPGGTLESWLTGTGASTSNYEVMATASSGTAPAGTLGSWLNCGTSNSWSITNTARDNSVVSGVIAVQIRDAATHTIQASASITLSAESDGL